MRTSTLKKFILIHSAGPICFSVVYLIGSASHFDGQAAILTLPFVLLFWLSVICAIAYDVKQFFWPTGDPLLRMWSGVALVFYGLLTFRMVYYLFHSQVPNLLF